MISTDVFLYGSRQEGRTKKTSNVSINIKMRRVRVTIVDVKQQAVIHIIGMYL